MKTCLQQPVEPSKPPGGTVSSPTPFDDHGDPHENTRATISPPLIFLSRNRTSEKALKEAVEYLDSLNGRHPQVHLPKDVYTLYERMESAVRQAWEHLPKLPKEKTED